MPIPVHINITENSRKFRVTYTSEGVASHVDKYTKERVHTLSDVVTVKIRELA